MVTPCCCLYDLRYFLICGGVGKGYFLVYNLRYLFITDAVCGCILSLSDASTSLANRDEQLTDLNDEK
jgi:hypothetical protein